MAKEFAWESEQQLGTVDVHDKEKRVVSLCSLLVGNEEEGEQEERWYVSISTWKYFKKKGEIAESWRAVKGTTIPLDIWDDINDMVQKACEEGEEE